MKREVCSSPDGYSDGVGLIICDSCYGIQAGDKKSLMIEELKGLWKSGRPIRCSGFARFDLQYRRIKNEAKKIKNNQYRK